MSLLSGTSRPLLLRLTAGLGAVIPTDCSKTLPKLPEGGNKRRRGFYMCQDKDRTGRRVELHWKRTSAINCHCSRDETRPREKKSENSGFSSSPRENSKLIGLSPIFLSIIVASNNAPNSRKLSMLSVSSWTQKH